jgi:glutamate:Na+ symporter, ESS family
MTEFGPYSMLIDFAMMSILLFIAQIIRAKVKWVQHLYLPTAMIAGFLGLFFGASFLENLSPVATAYAIPFSDQTSSYAYMLVVVLFASLYIGNGSKQSLKAAFSQVGDTFSLNMAAEFSGFGFALLVGGALLIFIVPDLTSTFPILQPAGFIGGHGYAAAIGTTLEESSNSIWGKNDAVIVGQTFATIGILCGIFGGLAAIKYATKKGYTRFVKGTHELPESLRTGFIAKQDQQSMGKATLSPAALDPLTWHALLILIATAGGYFSYHFVREILPITMPMMCLSMLAGVLLQKTLGVMKLQDTVDKDIITRMGSSVTDYLVAFGIASIKISVVVEYALPIVVLAIVGFVFPLLFLFVVSKRLFHNYWFERGIFIFGWSTGVVAMGVTLLRIVDPDFKSKALDDYGVAYIFISMVEIGIVSILPSVVAIAFITGNYGYTLIPGALMLFIGLALLVVTAYRYGIQSKDGASLRVGEVSGQNSEKNSMAFNVEKRPV